MKRVSARQNALPALLFPLFLSPTALAEDVDDKQTMVVSATPQVVSELDTPAAVSVVEGDDIR